MAGRGLKETENYFKCFICDVLYSLQLYQDIIKWENAVTVACHNGKMYIGRQREWRVTDCAKDLDFAAVRNSIGKKEVCLSPLCRWFLRIRWTLSRRLFCENSTSIHTSSMLQRLLEKTQDGQLSCSGRTTCSPVCQQCWLGWQLTSDRADSAP